MAQVEPNMPPEQETAAAPVVDTGPGISLFALVLAIIVLLAAILWVMAAKPLAGSRAPAATAPTSSQSQTGVIKP